MLLKKSNRRGERTYLFIATRTQIIVFMYATGTTVAVLEFLTDMLSVENQNQEACELLDENIKDFEGSGERERCLEISEL